MRKSVSNISILFLTIIWLIVVYVFLSENFELGSFYLFGLLPITISIFFVYLFTYFNRTNNYREIFKILIFLVPLVLIIGGLLISSSIDRSYISEASVGSTPLTNYKEIELGQLEHDFLFQNKGFIKKESTKSNKYINYNKQSGYVSVKILRETKKIDKIIVMCGEFRSHISVNGIFCNDSSSDLKKAYIRHDISVLCDQDDYSSRFYLIKKLNIGHKLKNNKLEAFIISDNINFSEEIIDCKKIGSS